jgi:hypothetical protein
LREKVFLGEILTKFGNVLFHLHFMSDGLKVSSFSFPVLFDSSLYVDFLVRTFCLSLCILFSKWQLVVSRSWWTFEKSLSLDRQYLESLYGQEK